MGEHFIAKDSISNLRRMNQVHLQKSGLKVALLWFVLLERIQKEGGCRLNHVLGHEDIHNPLDVHQGSVLVVDKLRRKLCTFLRVRSHDVLEESDIVWRVVDLLVVEHDLVGLPSLSEAGNDLARNIGTKVDTESERHVMETDDVSELLRAGQLRHESAC